MTASETWRVATGSGAHYGAVVSDLPPAHGIVSEGEVEAYGGYLIAESIAPEHRPLIAATPELLASLEWALPLLDLIPPAELIARGIEAEAFEAGCVRARTAVAKANGELGVLA